MKKTIYFLFISILFLTGCSQKTDFTLKGQIDGLLSDTLIAYYQVPEYEIDTIVCQKGIFEYSFNPDTLTVFTLVINEQEVIPIFAEKGHTVEIKGSTTDFSIKGKGENKLMNEIITLLRNTPQEGILNKVDSLIQTNNLSFTNLYLIDKYYAHDNSVDHRHLDELINKQSGIIKDTPYIMDLQTSIKPFTERQKTQVVHTLPGKDREGKLIKWPSVRNQYILLDFWASWHPGSVSQQDSLVRVLQALKKENFRVFSISLDLDKEAWLKASDRDTTQWHQICDFNGWNNQIVTDYNIHDLPFNLLLDKNKRIIARDIHGQELINKVKGLIKRDQEKEKNARKRKNKR